VLLVGIWLELAYLVLASGFVVAVGAFGAALVGVGRGLLMGRSIATAVALFLLPFVAVPFAQPVAMSVFRDDYVSFAYDVRSGEIPRTETFRVGPFTYDGFCDVGESIMIWRSDDAFMRQPAVVIGEDESIAITRLGESQSPIFQCDDDRLSR